MTGFKHLLHDFQPISPIGVQLGDDYVVDAEFCKNLFSIGVAQRKGFTQIGKGNDSFLIHPNGTRFLWNKPMRLESLIPGNSGTSG